MDGNGRWAERQGLARTDGHSQGEERLAEIVRAADALGIGWLTAYGFSTENWRRPRLEVDFILGLHKKIFGRRQEMHANNVKIRWIGRDTRAGSRIPGGRAPRDREVDPAHASTTPASTSRWRSTTAAARSWWRPRGRSRSRNPIGSTPRPCSRHLYAPELPPVDLMVRTSGEGRISNFLLWEGVGAHLYVTPTLWPDFGAAELDAAIEWWRTRTADRDRSARPHR